MCTANLFYPPAKIEIFAPNIQQRLLLACYSYWLFAFGVSDILLGLMQNSHEPR